MKALFLFLLATMLTPLCHANDDGGFLFVTFRGEQTPMSEQIYFVVSKDGKNWTSLNQDKPVLVSTVGEKGVRDAYILRSHDRKKFYLIATDLSINLHRDWHRSTHAGSKSIVIWDSADLVHWSDPRLVQVAPDDAGCTWAPEAIWDEERQDYLVYWASTTGSDNFKKQRIWGSHTKDFVTFDKPFAYMDNAGNVIDADIIAADGKFYRFSKDETFKAVAMEAGDKVDGPWQTITNFSLARMTGYEGPECFLLSPAANGQPATWCLLLDHYAKGAGYEPFLTTDLAGGQFTRATDFTFPYKMRHGAVLRLTKDEFDRLNEAFKSGP